MELARDSADLAEGRDIHNRPLDSGSFNVESLPERLQSYGEGLLATHDFTLGTLLIPVPVRRADTRAFVLGRAKQLTENLWHDLHIADLRNTGESEASGAALEQRQETLQDEYIEGRLTKEKWDRRFGDCQRELAALNVPDEPVQAVHGTLQSWLQLWEAASPEAKNKTARLVFDQIVIDFDTHEVTLVPNPEFQPLFEARRVYVRQTQPGPSSEKPAPEFRSQAPNYV